MSNQQNNRQYFLDWLRVIGIITVFFYHSIHFFDLDNWSIKNNQTYAWVSYLMDFLSVWIMPLIFMVSGFSIFYAIRKLSIKRFIYDKIMRLLVPLFIGIFTFSIMQVYLERRFFEQFQGSFFEFIPHYFNGLYLPGSTGNFAFHGMHLWYLLFLFIYSIVLMPVFYWFKTPSGSRVLNNISHVLSKGFFVFLFWLPTIILQNIGDNVLENGGWSLVQYPWFFVAGYLIASHQPLQKRIIKMRWIWLTLTLSFTFLTVIFGKNLNDHPDVFVWFILFTILGFAMQKLNFTNPFLTYSNQAVMPFYILHQNILLLIGYFIITWSLLDSIKYLVIVTLSLLIIMGLYEFLIRRSNLLRVLFGMRILNQTQLEKQKLIS